MKWKRKREAVFVQPSILRKSLYIGGIALLILNSGIFTRLMSTTSLHLSEMGEFELQILGGYGGGSFIPGPCPPNHTIECTWDSWGYTGLTLRIIWHGIEEVQVISITCWQDITIQGIHWNNTGPMHVAGPSYNLSTNDWYDFDIFAPFVE
ncbi:MAG: hypothetical protein JSV04_04730, partial [Candidatus Heimdallarchaeota archaeon]